jgi:CBS domain-containing protein
MTVRKLHDREPIGVRPETRFGDVAALSRAHPIGSVLARGESGNLAGIATETDLIAREKLIPFTHKALTLRFAA